MLDLQNVSKSYNAGGGKVPALHGLDLTLDRGDFLVAWGPSGSGKTTLLLMMGGMLTPDEGSVRFHGQDIYSWSSLRRNQYRRSSVGFVFQRFFLVPHLNVRDNILMPASFNKDGARVHDRATELAERLQLTHRLDHYPSQLSVGEQQRAAIARGLVCENELILADEPTGNLDERNVDLIARCFKEEQAAGRTLIVVTHDRVLLDIASRQVHLEAGHLVKQV